MPARPWMQIAMPDARPWWLPKARGPLFYIGLWLVMACGISLVLGSLNLPALIAIYQRPAAVDGRVVAKQPEYHASVVVEYVVDGSVYTYTSPFVGEPNPDYESLDVGDRVVVFYERTRPQNATFTDPARRLYNEAGAVAAAALGLPTVAVLFNLVIHGGLRAFGTRRNREATSPTTHVRDT